MDNFGGAGAYGGVEPGMTGPPMQQPGNKNRRLNLGAKDPLMKKAHKKVDAHYQSRENSVTAPANKIMQLAALAFVPFFIYVSILFLTVYRFFFSPVAVMSTFLLVAAVCIMVYLLVQHCTRKKEKKWKRWLGVYGALAALAGVSVGIAIHYQWMLFFYKYSNMMKYSNVAASQPALQFEDAGSLLFTEGTTLDKARAVGYRHIRSQQTLCVAPVVDGQMAPDDDIVFFAVGVNCCGWRANFKCDDATTAGTRGGLLMLEPNMLVSPAMEWMVDEQFDFKAFQEAIDLQKSVFAVSAAKHHRFLRWVKDPTEKIDQYRKWSLEAALLSCLLYLIVAGINIAVDLFKEGERQRQVAREIMKGHADYA